MASIRKVARRKQTSHSRTRESHSSRLRLSVHLLVYKHLTHSRTQLSQELDPLRKHWTANTLSTEEQFLRDYMTKQMWKGEEEDDAPYANFDAVRTLCPLS